MTKQIDQWSKMKMTVSPMYNWQKNSEGTNIPVARSIVFKYY